MTNTRTCSTCDTPVDYTRDAAFHHEALVGHRPTLAITEAKDVTEDLIDYAETWADQYDEGNNRIDWESLWDRIDATQMDETYWAIDLGDQYDSPAMRKIQREVRKRRREG